MTQCAVKKNFFVCLRLKKAINAIVVWRDGIRNSNSHQKFFVVRFMGPSPAWLSISQTAVGKYFVKLSSRCLTLGLFLVGYLAANGGLHIFRRFFSIKLQFTMFKVTSSNGCHFPLFANVFLNPNNRTTDSTMESFEKDITLYSLLRGSFRLAERRIHFNGSVNIYSLCNCNLRFRASAQRLTQRVLWHVEHQLSSKIVESCLKQSASPEMLMMMARILWVGSLLNDNGS